MAAIDSIKALRERGLSYKDIADKVGVAYGTIHKIAYGQRSGNLQAKKLAALVRNTPQRIPIESEVTNGARGSDDRSAVDGTGRGVETSASTRASIHDYASSFPDDLHERLLSLRNAGNPGPFGSAISTDRYDGQNVAARVGTFSEAPSRAVGNNALDAAYDSRVRQENRSDGRSSGAFRDDNGSAGTDSGESLGDSSGFGRPAARKGLSPIPFERGKGKSEKSKDGPTGAYAYVPWLKDARPLSVEEANGLREDVIYGLEALEQGFDEIISATNKQHIDAIIWSTIDREDNEFLADAMLRAALKDPAVAQAVRAIAESSAWLRAGLITLPRFFETVRFYRQYGVALPI